MFEVRLGGNVINLECRKRMFVIVLVVVKIFSGYLGKLLMLLYWNV